MNDLSKQCDRLRRDLAAKKAAFRRAASPPALPRGERPDAGRSMHHRIVRRAIQNPGATAAVVFGVISAVGPWQTVRLATRGFALVSLVTRLTDQPGRRR